LLAFNAHKTQYNTRNRKKNAFEELFWAEKRAWTSSRGWTMSVGEQAWLWVE
jgi:hypothetical protein